MTVAETATARPMRILLSPPEAGAAERRLVLDALRSGWIAPLGPHVDAFEQEVSQCVGVRAGVALSSGTAGLHLALVHLGIGPGDRVLTSTLTFAATANAIRYVGAEPVFVDVDPDTWQMDPNLVEEELRASAAANRLPRAVITVDLYGQCADHDAIAALCREYGDIPVVEDAAEALGASYRGRQAGSLGIIGIVSFNGNKIITTSGGGMVLTDDEGAADHIRHLATQARDPAVHYQHSEVGFNYRLSNLLAAVGRAQLRDLPRRVRRRRAINTRYRSGLADVPGLRFQEEAPYGQSTSWLTCLTVQPKSFGTDRSSVIDSLRATGIEARPVWKPLHLQPIFGVHCARMTGRAEQLFADGVALPSGSALTESEQDEIVDHVRRLASSEVPPRPHDRPHQRGEVCGTIGSRRG